MLFLSGGVIVSIFNLPTIIKINHIINFLLPIITGIIAGALTIIIGLDSLFIHHEVLFLGVIFAIVACIAIMLDKNNTDDITD